jgi:hypothetical protein
VKYVQYVVKYGVAQRQEFHFSLSLLLREKIELKPSIMASPMAGNSPVV